MRDLSAIVSQLLEIVPEKHELHYCLKAVKSDMSGRKPSVRDWDEIAGCMTDCYGDNPSRMNAWQREVAKIWNPYLV